MYEGGGGGVKKARQRDGWNGMFIMLLLKYENKIGMHYFQTVDMIQFVKKIVFLGWKQ